MKQIIPAVVGVRHGLAALLLIALSGPHPAGAFVFYSWQTGVSGLTSDATKWSPGGVPAFADRLSFSVPGTYTVTFPSATPTTNMITCSTGNITFHMTSPHTTSAFNVALGSAANSLVMDRGTLNVDYLELGDTGQLTKFYLAEDGRAHTNAVFHSYGKGNPNSGNTGDQIGHAGTSEMYVTGGSRYTCERTGPATGTMAMANTAGSAASLSISGSGGVPDQTSCLLLTGGASMTVGLLGAANLFVYNGGFIDATGDVLVAVKPSSNGYVTVGPGPGTSSINAHAKLCIGGNLAGANTAGHGEMTVKSSGRVSTSGACEVGDPDNDGGSLLRVQTGGIFTALGGLKVWPTAGVALALQGGLTHVHGGTFDWPAGKYMTISSTTGTPELWIDNGIGNAGPNTAANFAQLYVARSGNATLHLSRPGTAFTMGPGACVVGDSAGGDGTVIVDSTSTLTSGGPINVGNKGHGEWYVKNGSFADVGTVAVGVASGGGGSVGVTGAGSKLRARDNVWIGGGFGGVGGGGMMTVELGGTLEVLHVTGINPALITVFPAPLHGYLSVSQGGLVTTTGTVSNQGYIVLNDGEIDALNVAITPNATLAGYGRLVTMLQNNGNVDPGFDFMSMHTIDVDGNYTQFGAGHYIVDLDTAGGPASDLLEINGPATLAGTLDLHPATGFSGTPGEFFTILTCSTRTGTFNTVTWNGSPLAGQAQVVYGPTYVGVLIPGVSGVGEGGPGVGPAVLSFAPIVNGRQPGFALELPEAAQVQLKVYDLSGREVATLFDGRLEPTRRQFELRAPGRQLASGAYFGRAVIQNGDRTIVRTARAVLVH